MLDNILFILRVSITVCFWINKLSSAATDYILIQGTALSSNALFRIITTSSNTIQFNFVNTTLETTSTQTTNKWYHFACSTNPTTGDRRRVCV